MGKKTTGMLLGKFMPPHMGHITLANFAKNFVDELTIVVGSLKDEPIKGELRYQWMSDMFPNVNVVHLTDENPQYPEEHPDFWKIWHDSLMCVLPSKPDYVFAGEEYGLPLAQTLGAEFIPSNMGRSIIPVSATMIRNNPIKNWEYIAPAARPYFLKRISIVGAESTGKTTLAENLAKHFDTVHVPEYAYSYIKTYGKDLTHEDFQKIAKGQAATEVALAEGARGILICDTDLIMTEIWAEELLGKSITLQKKAQYDLTLLLDDDADWRDDVHRYETTDRKAMTDKCEALLKKQGRPYVKISGDWDKRKSQAISEISKILIQT